MPLVLNHQTKAQFIARLRQAYLSSEGPRTAQLAVKIQDWLDAGDLGDAEMRSAWGKSVAEWAQVKGRMISLRSAMASIRAARGE